MKYYEKLLEEGSFTRERLEEIAGSSAAAGSLIHDYLRKGYIERVKRDFYVTISLESRQPVLTRYQIGSRLFSDACISHHSAFEVYGYGGQVFYECYVATDSRFTDFEYSGTVYHRIERKQDIYVEENDSLRVTSIEQTVMDSIRDYEKIAGLEEVLRCMLLIPGLSEEKILDCLNRCGNGFLYQKCGYIFEALNEEFRFSNAFFEECHRHISRAKRYLMKDIKGLLYNERWKLYVPSDLRQLIDKGVGEFDAAG